VIGLVVGACEARRGVAASHGDDRIEQHGRLPGTPAHAGFRVALSYNDDDRVIR
jgi:hypothetical protein